MSLDKQLFRDVFDCDKCNHNYGFNRPTPEKPYFKFPPTIGATGKADLLFVGINPRISENNRNLHHRIIGDKRAFADLAENRDGDKAYIATGCKEKHYHHHMNIVKMFYGEGSRFEDHAVVTELFLCATGNTQKLPRGHYPCANRFFDRVFLKVQPRFVICIWKRVFDYFQKQAHIVTDENFPITIGGHTSAVIYLPHPNSYRH
ncbi:MAG TPA: hypothetical protein VGI03_11285 [Verrucomicrobiae bacterium]|jgi:hypothetical protein